MVSLINTVKQISNIVILLFLIFLLCSCNKKYEARDKAITSSNIIDDTEENIYFVKDNIIYVIDKNSLIMSDSGLKGRTVYIFNGILYYNDMNNCVYKGCYKQLSLDFPFHNFIVTKEFICFNSTDTLGKVYYYDIGNDTVSEAINNYPIIANDSTVYTMKIIEGDKTEDDHIPVKHILDLDGNDITSFIKYDCNIPFNDNNFYIYKNYFYYIDSGQIYQTDLIADSESKICAIGDEIIAVAHDYLFIRCGTNLCIKALPNGESQYFPNYFVENYFYYVDSYNDFIYAINLIDLTVEKSVIN